MTLSAERIAAMERATLDAVPPAQRDELHGWLVGIDDGVVSRARSAAPLRHDAGLVQAIEVVMQRYADSGKHALFRVPDTEGLQMVGKHLARLGAVPESPTIVQCADSAVVAGAASHLGSGEGLQVTLTDRPDEAWCALFLGDGVGAAEAQSRTAVLRRARHALYARVQVDGETVAVGMGSFSHGWASVHGLRTRTTHRGRGHAGAIVRRLAQEAAQRGLTAMFLQVEAANNGAQALYRRLGFCDLWTYRYWRLA